MSVPSPIKHWHLYNNPFVIEQSQHLANVVRKKTTDGSERIRFAWQQALGLDVTPVEQQQADEFLRLTQDELASEEKAWASLCQALLVTNESRYVD